MTDFFTKETWGQSRKILKQSKGELFLPRIEKHAQSSLLPPPVSCSFVFLVKIIIMGNMFYYKLISLLHTRQPWGIHFFVTWCQVCRNQGLLSCLLRIMQFRIKAKDTYRCKLFNWELAYERPQMELCEPKVRYCWSQNARSLTREEPRQDSCKKKESNLLLRLSWNQYVCYACGVPPPEWGQLKGLVKTDKKMNAGSWWDTAPWKTAPQTTSRVSIL